MVVARYVHDPSAILDYAIDWTPYLAEGDTLTDAQFAVYTDQWGEPDPAAAITITDHTYNNSVAVAWVSGATANPGQKFYLTCHIVTSGGREDDRTIQISIKEE